MAHTTIGAVRQSLPGRVALVKKYAGFEVWNRLTARTPRRSGRAAASWNMSVSEPDPTVPPEAAHVPPPVPPRIGEIPPGEPLIISSSLVYIRPLNNGHSGQAPAGFVEAAVDEVVAAMPGLVRSVKRLAEQGAVS